MQQFSRYLGRPFLLMMVIGVVGCGGGGPNETPSANAGQSQHVTNPSSIAVASVSTASSLSSVSSSFSSNNFAASSDDASSSVQSIASSTPLSSSSLTQSSSSESMIDTLRYAPWQPTIAYVTGDRVYHDGQYYQAKWWTLDESPSTFAGGSGLPWLRLDASQIGSVSSAPVITHSSVATNSSAAAIYPEWEATKAYVAGDRVNWQQQSFEAKWWNLNKSPSQFAGGAGLPWLALEASASSPMAASSVATPSSSVAVSSSTSVSSTSLPTASSHATTSSDTSSNEQSSASAMSSAASSSAAPLLAPSAVVAVPSASNDIIGVSWGDNSANETAFVLERRENDGAWEVLATLNADEVSFADAKVTTGNRYQYRVASRNDAEQSAWAEGETVTLTAQQTEGEILFASHCAFCHKDGGIGGALNTPFVKNRWAESSYTAFLAKVASMPVAACDTSCQNTIASDLWLREWGFTIELASQQAAGVRGLRQLTPREYANVVATTLGVTLDEAQWPKPHFDSHFKYPSDAEHGVFLYDTVLANQQRAQAVSAQVNLTQVGCTANSCSQTQALALAKRLLKRPLTDDEAQAYSSINQNDGARALIEALLISPDVNYHITLGTWDPAKAMYRLTAFEVASELSFQLWGLPPDDVLLAKAEQGLLNSYTDIANQISAMLTDARFGTHFSEFIRHYSHTHQTVSEKPGLSQALINAMIDEQTTFVSDWVLGESPTLDQLFNPTHTFINSDLASFYGLESAYPQGSTGVQKVATPSTRGGLLHWGITQAANSDFAATSLVKRGKMMREHLLCHTMGIPVGVDPDTIELPAHAISTRERWDVITGEQASNGQCWQCHQLMNEPGSALEHYDQTGRYRTTELAYNDSNTQVNIDAAGTLRDNAGASLANYNDARELAEILATSDLVQACFVESYFRHSTGHTADQYTQTVVDGLSSSFKQSGNVRQLIIDALLSDAFLYRLDR